MEFSEFISSNPPVFQGSLEDCLSFIGIEDGEVEVSPGMYVMSRYSVHWSCSPDQTKRFIRIRDETIRFIEVDRPVHLCAGFYQGYFYFRNNRIPLTKENTTIVEELDYNGVVVEGVLFKLFRDYMEWGNSRVDLSVRYVYTHPKFNHVYVQSDRILTLNLQTKEMIPATNYPYRVSNKEVILRQYPYDIESVKYYIFDYENAHYVYSKW